MTETRPTASAPPEKPAAERWTRRWLFPLLRIVFLVFAAWLVWYTAGHWDRWTGAARFETTDDAFVSGDVTPLSARVSGYITEMPVNDFQTVRKGDLIAVIDPSDYQAQLDLAQANLAAAQATLANLANQRVVQQALVQEAEATIDATEADVLRYQLEDERQRNLFKTGIAGTKQLVEQADDNAKRALAQRRLNAAQLDQQKAALAAIDIQEKQLKAQTRAAEAQVALAADNLRYTRILSPADGLVGERQVRLGQFVNVGTQVIAVLPLPNLWITANFKETQMTNIRIGQPARVAVDAFPDLKLMGHVDSWSPGTGSTFALLPPDNATGNFTKVVQRVPVKIVLDQNASLGSSCAPECRSRRQSTPARQPARAWAPPRAPRRRDFRPRPARRAARRGAGARSDHSRRHRRPGERSPAHPAQLGFAQALCRHPWRPHRRDPVFHRQPHHELWACRSARGPALRV